MEVDDGHIFVDEAQSGRSGRRSGFAGLQRAIERKEVDVVIVFSTSRLARKTYRALMFVEEEIVDRRLRCVFVSSQIDTDDKDRWRTLLQSYASIDEITLQLTAKHVQAAHESQLRAGIVFGSLTYGFTGEAIEGQLTRRGLPVRRLAVKPETARWARQIFDWFVKHECSISRITAKLNEARAPLPEKSRTGRFTPCFVRRALDNRRYVGEWSYGETEVVWQNKADYARQFARERPLATVQLEGLRIIDQAIFDQAQAKLADYARRAGRKPRDGNVRDRPRVLNGLFECPAHGKTLHVCGKHGSRLGCHVCRTSGERTLYSTLPRALANRVVFEAVAALLRPVDALMDRVVESCRRQAEGLQLPDETELDEKRAEHERLTRKIAFILSAPGETEEDEEENRATMAELRRRRSVVATAIKKIEQDVGRQPKVPAPEEVRAMLETLADTLDRAAAGDDPALRAAAKRVVEAVTGGSILLSQCGEARRGRGWLRATFRATPFRALCEALGIPPIADEPREVVLEFREPSLVERLADPVMELISGGVLQKEVPAKLREKGFPEVSGVIVKKAVTLWHERRGLPVPDGRSRGSTKDARSAGPPLHQRVADAVMELYQAGAFYGEIAARLGIDRNVVTAAVAWWHESRGLPVPDGRSRRRALRLAKESRAA